MESIEEIFIIAWMLFGIYMLVLILVIADLWAGVRKARLRQEMRSSYGYRKTIHKIAHYYNALLALTVIDCMQMGSIWYLDTYYHYAIPVFPLTTLIGAIGIGLIEIKSIYEKAEDKVKKEAINIGLLTSQILRHKADPEEVAKAILAYMKHESKDADSQSSIVKHHEENK